MTWSRIPATWFHVLSCILTMLFAAISHADTLRVPSEYRHIQDAIDAAEDGDVVLIADGRYIGTRDRNLDFLGKAITVRSENGPESCIIDCEEKGRGFIFRNGEDENSVLRGVRIQNGIAEDEGGGIRIEGASPRIVDCRFVSNRSEGFQTSRGGGLAIIGGALYLDSCSFESNYAESDGGGIYCGADAFLFSCRFDSNQVELRGRYGHGGAVCLTDNCHLRAFSCDFIANLSNGGGAVYGDGDFLDCIFDDNSTNLTWGDGGAVVGDGVFWGCAFRRNWADAALGNGGAVRCQRGTFIDCLFDSNGAQDGGAVDGDETTFQDCAFEYNAASEEGGAVLGGTLFDRCSFVGNIAHEMGPGAVETGNAEFIDCEFQLNESYSSGGAVRAWAECTFTRCSFQSNFSDSFGGAVAASAGGTFTDCIFESNHGYDYGVAFFGSGNFVRCKFIENDGSIGGPVVDAIDSTFIQCEFERNVAAPDYGTGILHVLGQTLVQDSAFRTNESLTDGGATIVSDGSQSVLRVGNTECCENAPRDIDGHWIDLGGNSFSEWCNCLHVEIENLVAGELATCEVVGGTPGRRVVLLWGVKEGSFDIEQNGWCASFDFNVPLYEIGNRVIFVGTLDASGELSRTRRVPPGASGEMVRFQATMKGTCPDTCMSNVVKVFVQ